MILTDDDLNFLRELFDALRLDYPENHHPTKRVGNHKALTYGHIAQLQFMTERLSRKQSDGQKALVLNVKHPWHLAEIRHLFPGWTIINAGELPTGRRYQTIVVGCRADNEKMSKALDRWLSEFIPTLKKPEGQIL